MASKKTLLLNNEEIKYFTTNNKYKWFIFTRLHKYIIKSNFTYKKTLKITN